MKLRSALLASAVGLLAVGPALATNTFTLSFSTTLTNTGGSDVHGFDGSTWSFVFTTNQTNYIDVFSFAAVSTSDVSLTISGATNTDYNSTFAITEQGGTNFLLLPTVSGNANVGLGTDGLEGQFTFGPDSLLFDGFNFIDGNSSPPPASTTSAIQVSDWAGVVLSDGGFVISDGSASTFSAGAATLTVTDLSGVPEPSSYAAFLAVAALGYGVSRRRLRRSVEG